MRVRPDYGAMTDGELVEAARRGDHRAFDQLFVRYSRQVHALCVSLLGSETEAEDVAQETFVRAWRSLDQFETDRSLWPWLRMMTRRLCIDARRRAVRLERISQKAGLEVSRASAVELSVRENDGDLEDLLAPLNPRYRRLLLLHARYGWTYQQLAEAEGCSVTAVAKVLTRAREALRGKIVLPPALALFMASGVLKARRKLVLATHGVIVVAGVLTLAVFATPQRDEPIVHAPERSPVAGAHVGTLLPERLRRAPAPTIQSGAPRHFPHVEKNGALISLTPKGPPPGIDPSGGGLAVEVRTPDGETLVHVEAEHRCSNDGTLTAPGSLISVRC